jgi:hypothetical protein
MQPSRPRLSLVTRAEFTVMALRQSKNPSNGKFKPTETQKGETGKEQSQEHAHNFEYRLLGCDAVWL